MRNPDPTSSHRLSHVTKSDLTVSGYVVRTRFTASDCRGRDRRGDIVVVYQLQLDTRIGEQRAQQREEVAGRAEQPGDRWPHPVPRHEVREQGGPRSRDYARSQNVDLQRRARRDPSEQRLEFGLLLGVVMLRGPAGGDLLGQWRLVVAVVPIGGDRRGVDEPARPALHRRLEDVARTPEVHLPGLFPTAHDHERQMHHDIGICH